MKVVLAYPYDGHEPDETIDVDDEFGSTLIREGRARPAPQEPDAEPDTPQKASTKATTNRATDSPSTGKEKG